MQESIAKFSVGQLIAHLKFGYRGVIYDVDPVFAGTDEWYEAVAQSRPPKHLPWYHVLVDGAEHTTYVAEQHLTPDTSDRPINHPLIGNLFSGIKNGSYVSDTLQN